MKGAHLGNLNVTGAEGKDTRLNVEACTKMLGSVQGRNNANNNMRVECDKIWPDKIGYVASPCRSGLTRIMTLA